MTKVKNQARKQKHAASPAATHEASRPAGRARTHDKAVLAEMKAGQQTPGMEPMTDSGEMAMRTSRKKEKRFGHN